MSEGCLSSLHDDGYNIYQDRITDREGNAQSSHCFMSFFVGNLYLTHLIGFNTPSHSPLYHLNARALVLGSGCCTGSILGQLGPVTAEDVNYYILV